MATGTAVRTPTDAEIQQDVIEEFRWEQRVLPNEVGVVVNGGVVTLTGWVDSYTGRWAADDAAHRVRGVMAVANDIEVRLPSTPDCRNVAPELRSRTDSDVAAAAIRALEWDALSGVTGVTNLITVKRASHPKS